MSEINQKGHACPCCGYLTLTSANRGTFEICPVCCWEDDNVQFDDEDYAGGANRVSLRQARINFALYKVSSIECKRYVRPPKPSEIPGAI